MKKTMLIICLSVWLVHALSFNYIDTSDYRVFPYRLYIAHPNASTDNIINESCKLSNSYIDSSVQSQSLVMTSNHHSELVIINFKILTLAELRTTVFSNNWKALPVYSDLYKTDISKPTWVRNYQDPAIFFTENLIEKASLIRAKVMKIDSYYFGVNEVDVQCCSSLDPVTNTVLCVTLYHQFSDFDTFYNNARESNFSKAIKNDSSFARRIAIYSVVKSVSIINQVKSLQLQPVIENPGYYNILGQRIRTQRGIVIQNVNKNYQIKFLIHK
jgi:hypothetical protein